MSAPQHTPGPWRWEYCQERKHVHLVGGRPEYDLTVIDFVRCGMGGAIPRFRDTAPGNERLQLMFRLNSRPDWIAPEPGREHHRSWHQLVTHPDARLIEAAPRLLAALEAMLAIHTEPANFDGKYGRELDAAIDAQQIKVDAATARAIEAIAQARGAEGGAA